MLPAFKSGAWKSTTRPNENSLFYYLADLLHRHIAVMGNPRPSHIGPLQVIVELEDHWPKEGRIAADSDWQSYSVLNDIDGWMVPFFGASVYNDPALYLKSDSIRFVRNVKTPTLILVGDRDGEVPMAQSIEWYRALETTHVPTQMVVYPNEGHVFLRACRCTRLHSADAATVLTMVR